MKEYVGKLLRINLSLNKISIEEIPHQYFKDYLGGSGLAAKYLYDENDFSDDVFSENNKLVFSVGPLNGTNYPTSGRFNVSCRSPLTKAWLDASASGRFGNLLKKAGYDVIIIEGKSEKPVYLYVNNDEVQLRDATEIWGEKTSKTIERIALECGNIKGSCCAIGPAGEGLVKMASIICSGGRAVGRGGAGALMGSKNLKAVFVYGDKGISLQDELGFKETVKAAVGKLSENDTAKALKAYGTGVSMALAFESGDAPTKNWKQGSWDGYMKISGITMAKTMLKKYVPECYACPIQCARHVEIEEGPYAMKGNGPEYETLGAFGSMCLNDNLESIAYANILCREYGLDTISVGSAIAFAMEAHEKGILEESAAAGIDLKWGNVEAILSLIEKIARAEGLGELLGQGVRRAAEVLGKGSEAFAVHVKGLELPMHDPRANYSMATTYATSPRGGCHMHGPSFMFERGRLLPDAGIATAFSPHETENKGYLAKVIQDYGAVVCSSVICMFTTVALTPSDLSKAIEQSIGLKLEAAELLKAGERIVNLQRAFNIRLGLSSQDDTLPPRVLTSVEGGPIEGRIPNFHQQLEEYYCLRKWEKDGRPSKEKLLELGLESVNNDLY